MTNGQHIQKVEAIKALYYADCEVTGITTECAIDDAGYAGMNLDMLESNDIETICTFIRAAFDAKRNEIPAEHLAAALSL